jgi:hypothetical protein
VVSALPQKTTSVSERDWTQETTAFLHRTYPELAEGNKPLSVQIQRDQRL